MFRGLFIDFDIAPVLLESIVDTTSDGPKKSAVARATGMSYAQLEGFLKEKGLAHSGTRMSTNAIPELKKWYIGKMRRYVRNALTLKLAPDSEEGLLFFQFCSKYLKRGHRAVQSWDDIDETRLLMDFEDACYKDHTYVFSTIDREDNLLDRIHRCYLFSSRIKIAPNYCVFPAKPTISFILSNRYHIFTGEADSNQSSTVQLAHMPHLTQLNQPWSASQHVFASLAKA